MNKRSLRLLEYNKILTMLAEYAASPMAKKKCDRLKPMRSINEIKAAQQQTRDALLRLDKCGSVSFSGLRDIGASLKRLKVQGALTSKELLDLAALLETANSVKSYGEAMGSELSADSLTESFNMLIPLIDISSEIRRCIIAEDEIADDASPRLKSIRRSINAANDRIHRQLAGFLNDEETRGRLQDSIITMRNGRYCVPVKQEYRSQVAGMIHDQSGSGSTLFIEPMAIVSLNNEIKELKGEELIEIDNILEDLSLRAASAVSDIEYDSELLTELDFIFARARFAKSYNGSEPLFNTDGIIDIKGGRHPLLEKHSVVPVDIRLGEGYRLLIVTGPNTGGKTVSLKTLGLFTLMGQAGLHIPALYGSRLAVFDDVFADIGDEQSIEQNLSTFSSHMSNVIYIVGHATRNTLCLFDELGGGTDPTEGAALAIAILNYLRELGATCMATTHYSELKTYALTTDDVENASCEFDVASLRPTYKLMIGIPGKSNAFAISKKLGLPDYIIESAKERLDTNSVDMEALIADLEKNRRDTDEAKKQAEADRAEAEALKTRLQKKESDLADKRAEILAKARSEARDILEDAKEVADQTIRDCNKWRNNLQKTDMRAMEEKRSSLRNKINTYGKSDSKQAPVRTSNHKAKDFHIGDSVLVISMNSKGTVTSLPDSKGTVTVQMGILSSKLPISDLIIQEDKAFITEAEKNRTKSRSITGKAMTFSPEINVMGKTVDEAVQEIDKYLDDAVLSHMNKVTIIHGKGTGALRNGIQQYLKKHPLVKSYRAGEFGEGEYGVTIVEL